MIAATRASNTILSFLIGWFRAVYTLCSTRHSKAIGNLLQRLYRGQRQSDAPYKRNEQ